MQNVIVFFGGKSCEHDISIITGFQVAKNLDETKYNVFPIYITKVGKWCLCKNLQSIEQFQNFDEKTQVNLMPGDNILYANKKFKKKLGKIDCAIIACHGMNGEDGTLQGLLELSQIPYSTSGVVSSGITMDKVFMKQIFEVNNLPITNYFWFKKYEYENKKEKILKDIQLNLTYPMIVKPANLGSSIGIKKCENLDELKSAIEVALNYDTKILIEEVVEHLTEINCAVLGFNDNITISSLEQPISWENFLSFDQKYLQFTGAKFEQNSNPKIPNNIKSKIKKMSKFIFQKLDCTGVIRIDFLLNTDTEELYINEINSIPGSFANFLFANITFENLLDKIIIFAKEKFNEKQNCSFSYESNVLEKFNKNNKLNKI